MNRTTTIREYFASVIEKPTVFFMPKVEADECGLEDWSNLPNGTWIMSKVPDSILDKEFSNVRDERRIPSFIAWSPNCVYHVYEEYDGSCSICWTDRNPKNVQE